jgi:hypothetical protein
MVTNVVKLEGESEFVNLAVVQKDFAVGRHQDGRVVTPVTCRLDKACYDEDPVLARGPC